VSPKKKLGRFPFVDRDDILSAYRPGEPPSESRFRTLRRREVVSHGISLPIRKGNRFAGQVRAYSALNVDAAVLARHGEIKQAQRIAKKAERQEDRWEPKLEELLASINLESFEALQRFRNQVAHQLLPLAQDVEKVRASFSTILNKWVEESLGELTQITSKWASLQLLTPPRDVVEIQRSLLNVVPLALGDLAVLRIERLVDASLVRVVPVVTEGEESSAEARAYSDEGLSDYLTRLLEPVEIDPKVAAAAQARRREGSTVQVPPRRIRLAA
jgi:malonyl CoA-acyl carrier protein transacylase